MKVSPPRLVGLALILGLTLASGLEKRDCAPDNCLRQIRATRPAGQQNMASSDCSSYLAGSTTTVTVTPGFGQTVTASTTTKTVKTTSTKTILTTSLTVVRDITYTAIVSTSIIPDLKRRAGRKAVPTYASACTLEDQYASACSCYGVLPPFTKTKTAHSVMPVTVTKTITTTISTQTTITKTIPATSTSTSFRPIFTTITVQASSFALYVVGGVFDGYYLNALEEGGGLSSVSLFFNDPFALPSFVKLTQGNLWLDSEVAVAGAENFNGFVFEIPGFYDPDVPQLVCSVAGGFLSCETSEGANTFYGCTDNSGEQFPPAVYFFPPNAVVGDNCSPIQLKQLLV